MGDPYLPVDYEKPTAGKRLAPDPPGAGAKDRVRGRCQPGIVATVCRQSFSLEPYAYREARALMDGLGLAEPVAVTLVRRGYRTVADARAFLEAADDHDPFAFAGMAEVCERIRGCDRGGPADHRPRRLRRRRRLGNGDLSCGRCASSARTAIG